ncbi:unnamed protein product [Chondrus crispus]|uniref:Uncharacterized protein n=1 Tax=Chondrus crispus TaxID=2769 RepID=R7QMI8_CHOCR|nr:unnamed protein product [Chondrus crispus]CDF38696.1 unnamed protein product [Chondrus crispus]|eukprot:XP_005718601.1 unnamed protein product [Chondrus crispus]
MKPTRRPLLARGSADNAHVRHAAAPAARLRLDLLHTRRTTRNVMNLIIDLIHQLRRPRRPALEHGDHIGDPPRRQHISPDGADNLDAALPLIHPSPDQAGVHDVQHDVLDLSHGHGLHGQACHEVRVLQVVAAVRRGHEREYDVMDTLVNSMMICLVQF